MHDFHGRIPEFRVGTKSFEGFGVGALLAGRGRHRPAAEGIETPGADVIGVGFRGIGFFERLTFGHVAISDGNESGGPFVFVARFDFFEGFAEIGRDRGR